MTYTPSPWHTRLAMFLALLIPVYLMTAALGTKFGLWGWEFGLGTMLIAWGPIVIGAVGLIALASLIACVAKPPRHGWSKSLLALMVPVVIFAGLAYVRSQAGAIPPIHDVTTAPDNVPQFSDGWVQRRANASANPLLDYSQSLNQSEMYQSERFAELGARTLTEINTESYGNLEPLSIGSSTPAQAQQAVEDAMRSMGATEVLAHNGRVEGTFETFWFGFKDDVVARIAGGQIDFRSVSRVGVSDLGKNAERIGELRAATAQRLR